jgi:hypothetical protein
MIKKIFGKAKKMREYVGCGLRDDFSQVIGVPKPSGDEKIRYIIGDDNQNQVITSSRMISVLTPRGYVMEGVNGREIQSFGGSEDMKLYESMKGVLEEQVKRNSEEALNDGKDYRVIVEENVRAPFIIQR